MSRFQEIIDFNMKTGLLDSGYDDKLEASFQIEEALEGFNDLGYLATRLDYQHEYIEGSDKPKTLSRKITSLASNDVPLTDVQRFDKHLDAIVYNVGSLAKLGLDVDQMLRGLDKVILSNQAKLGCPRDEVGKLMKPANFDELYAPEPELQKILDEREL